MTDPVSALDIDQLKECLSSWLGGDQSQLAETIARQCNPIKLASS
ncbi:MAG: hypothetical protein WBN40_13885 [Pseudomonadales bacterium]